MDEVKIEIGMEVGIMMNRCETRQSHCIYLISPKEESGRCKVGITGNINKRVADLESASGVRLGVDTSIGCCCSYHAKQIEETIHFALKSRRGLGEWFNLDKDEIIRLATYFVTIEQMDMESRETWHEAALIMCAECGSVVDSEMKTLVIDRSSRTQAEINCLDKMVLSQYMWSVPSLRNGLSKTTLESLTRVGLTRKETITLGTRELKAYSLMNMAVPILTSANRIRLSNVKDLRRYGCACCGTSGQHKYTNGSWFDVHDGQAVCYCDSCYDSYAVEYASWWRGRNLEQEAEFDLGQRKR